MQKPEVESDNLQIRSFNEKDFTQAMERFIAVRTNSSLSREQRLTDFLELGCDIFDMEMGIIAHIYGNTYSVEHVYTRHYDIKPGQKFELGATYCALMVGSNNILDIPHMQESEYAEHPCYQHHGLEAYLGIALQVDSNPYGTLNFTARAPRKGFHRLELQLLRLLAAKVMDELTVESRLRQLEQERIFYRALLDNVPDMIFVKDEDLNIISANKAFLALYNKLPEQIIGTTTFESFPPEQAEGFRARDLKVFREGQDDTEEEITNASGEKKTYHTRKVVFDLPDGQRVLVGVARDIEHTKQQQHRLKLSEERYRELYYKTPVMLHSTNSEEALIHVSDFWLQEMGYSREEVTGRVWMDFLAPHSQIYAREKVLPELYTTGYCNTVPYQFMRKNGTLIDVLLSAVSTFDAEGKLLHTLAVSIDVTENNRNALELAKYTADLEQSNQALESFARVASHDLKEPPRKIATYGDLLTNEYYDELSEKPRRYIERMRDAARRMNLLIDDLLGFARIRREEHDDFANVNLNQVLRDIMFDLSREIRDVAATIDIEDLPVIRGSEVQLRSLFQNLIGNSLKYHHPRRRPHIQLTAQQQGDGWCFKVQDNGIGFEQKYAERIFDMFERLHSNSGPYQGTGIGLATCARIVQYHGGSIQAEGKPDEGAVFTVLLPSEHERKTS